MLNHDKVTSSVSLYGMRMCYYPSLNIIV